MDASFFSKPLSQLECRDNKKSCHLLEKKGTHPMRMHDNNTTCNRSNQNAGFLDTTNTTCNRSNQNARLPDTHSCSTNQHPATPNTTKTTCCRSAAQCWKAFLVASCFWCWNNATPSKLLKLTWKRCYGLPKDQFVQMKLGIFLFKTASYYCKSNENIP